MLPSPRPSPTLVPASSGPSSAAGSPWPGGFVGPTLTWMPGSRPFPLLLSGSMIWRRG